MDKITCADCGETFEYEDDKKTVDCMPDGFLHRGNWYCSDCGS